MVVDSQVIQETVQDIHLQRDRSLDLLKSMYLTRLTDDKMSKLVRQNKGGTFHLSVCGHEMIGCASAKSLIPEKDWGLPYYRDRAFAIGLGCELEYIFGAFLARDVPHHSGGRMMPEHYSHKRLRLTCQSSVVGSQFLQAVGVAKGLQIQGKNDVVYVSAGDGSTSQGDFHEALNFACIHKLSVIFVIQDNGWAISVPVENQTAGGSIVHIASGYKGLSVFDIDGCDFEQVDQALSTAVDKARNGQGPSLVVAKVPRIGAHSSSDDPSKYKEKTLQELDRSKDPIPRLESWIISKGYATDLELSILKDTCFKEVERAAELADQYPFPDLSSCDTKVFKDHNISEVSYEGDDSSSGQDAVVMVDSINHGLDEAMRADSSVVVFGQDVAFGKGGVFGVTRTLTDKYGVDRCFNTPLAESTIIGIAIGMSFTGLKPVAEIQFADYIWTGMNQLVNELANIHYRSNGEWSCPVVVRMPYGGYIQGGPYHSQSIEAFLSHCPGLKIVIPSNASDAKKLLKAAIDDPNPVVILEHKALYRQRVFCARKEPKEDEIIPLGKAKVVRSGTHVTVVCWGMLVFMASQVADSLASEGISVEVIDLRSIVPLDMETVLTSVKKTGKCLIAHEAVGHAGLGAEISAKIVEQAFAYLDAPIQRVTGKNCMVPYCKQLEDEVLPQLDDLEKGIRDLASF
ncbi:MAG: MFS transporter [Chlamydiae bacterium]|nr:MFS transporter [Chlamydiota bacterium]